MRLIRFLKDAVLEITHPWRSRVERIRTSRTGRCGNALNGSAEPLWDSAVPTEAVGGHGFQKHSANTGVNPLPAGRQTHHRKFLDSCIGTRFRRASKPFLGSRLLPGLGVALGLGDVVPRHVLTSVPC